MRYVHGEPMNCEVCGRRIPVDEVQWDLYIDKGFKLCIDCEPEDMEVSNEKVTSS
jgi:hypothetical protein